MSLATIRKNQEYFKGMSEKDQRRFLLNFFRFASSVDQRGKTVLQFQMEGRDVCRRVWLLNYGIAKTRCCTKMNSLQFLFEKQHDC